MPLVKEQQKKIEDVGRKLKDVLPDFTGSINYDFSVNKNDVKYKIIESGVVKK